MTRMNAPRLARIAVASLAALTLTAGAVALTGCGESDAQVTSGESSAPTTGTRFWNTPARPGPMISTARIQQTCPMMEVKTAT